MGIRIDQHGLAPERIWALIAIAISTAYGLAYWVGIARGRVEGWSAYLRRANLHLAVVTCGIALFLALPILDFGAISTRDQLARLESGEVAPSEFDYAALRWDFGDAGREALAQLEESDDETIAYLAQTAQAQIERPYIWDREDFAERATEQTFVVYPEGSDLPSGLRAAIANSSFCPSETICRVYLQQDGETAVALRDGCAAADGEGSEQINPRTNCYIETRAYERREDGWRPLEGFADDPMTGQEEAAALRREREAIESGNVRIERSQQRSIFIGDKETGRPFR